MKLQTKPLLALLTAAVIFSPAFLSLSCRAPASPLPTQAPPANRAPLIQSINGSTDWQPQADGEFTCAASDPDGDNLTYTWTADNGKIKGSGASAIWTSPPWMGKYHITVTVSDGKGGEARAVLEVKVAINADGSFSQDAPAVLKISFTSQDNVTVARKIGSFRTSQIECIVDSPDAKNLKYTWTATGGTLYPRVKGVSMQNSTASSIYWISPNRGDDYSVNVTVTDGNGNEAKGQVNYKVICCTTE